MRFLRLRFQRFAHFQDVTLDLAAGHEGLHLVYGANEAGKSAALRTIHGFLFGVPVQGPDTFRHGGPALRVHATLRSADGSIRILVRRKGAKQTLRDEADQPVADEVLRAVRARRTKHARLERLQKAVSLLAVRQGHMDRLAALAGAPDLAEDFPVRRQAAQTALAATREDLAVPEALLAEGPAIVQAGRAPRGAGRSRRARCLRGLRGDGRWRRGARRPARPARGRAGWPRGAGA